MTASLGACLYCDEPAAELHHWTAALTPDGEHLDPASTVSLCVACHHAEHQAWRSLGLDVFDDALCARFVRLTWLVQRLADVAEHAGPPTLDARSLRGIHDVLLRIAEDLTQHQGWEAAS